ncbi:MAG: hypothetical protein IRY90_04380 [Actinomadura rubrobrunea]|nr:hypothetical protein [Actinomadura rubrobrunea]
MPDDSRSTPRFLIYYDDDELFGPDGAASRLLHASREIARTTTATVVTTVAVVTILRALEALFAVALR